ADVGELEAIGSVLERTGIIAAVAAMPRATRKKPGPTPEAAGGPSARRCNGGGPQPRSEAPPIRTGAERSPRAARRGGGSPPARARGAATPEGRGRPASGAASGPRGRGRRTA